jgi:para-aminobenzoate synthetase component I
MALMTLTTGLDLDAVLARLPAEGDFIVVRDGARTMVGLEPSAVLRSSGTEALRNLDTLTGWWAGFLSYDLGRAIEAVPELAAREPVIPDLLLARFDARLVLEPDGTFRIDGELDAGAAVRTLLDAPARDRSSPHLRGWRSSLDRGSFERAVEQILEHLRNGDCYQVNLTRRLETDSTVDPVDLFRTIVAGNPSPHAALVRIGDIAVVSASPERFLRRDGARVQTRPIKGTSSDRALLAASAKDRAENVMIVDLARNDLGRVCRYRSVKVPALCEIEQHPGLHHLVSTVSGTLRDGISAGELIAAVFPPASVTGCPKPRVLEIIESLEPVRRGVYCGAIGFIDADNDVLDLNVAIRTFMITGGRSYFGVGSGIVADSDPGAEWGETELKAARLLELAAGKPV